MPVIDRAAPPRSRLLQAMAAAVAAKGYAAVTVSDVVSAAGVSKRTFYEFFPGKQECLLACYAEAGDALAEVLRAAAAAAPPGRERVAAGLDAYFAAMDANPQFAVALLVEIQAAGTPGRLLRREKTTAFAELIRGLAPGAPDRAPALDRAQAIALVGGLYELALTHAETSPDRPFRTLAPAAFRFVSAVLGLPREEPAGRPG